MRANTHPVWNKQYFKVHRVSQKKSYFFLSIKNTVVNRFLLDLSAAPDASSPCSVVSTTLTAMLYVHVDKAATALAVCAEQSCITLLLDCSDNLNPARKTYVCTRKSGAF